MEEDSSLITIRKEKLREIREELQINPFPYRYDVTHYSAEIFANFDEYSASQQTVSVAGRIMTVRIMGKASFCTIQDRDGKIQLYVAEKNIGETGYRLFKKLDIGDIIGARGTVRKTQMGEMTVFITELTLLSKNIRPLPVVKEKDGELFDAFADKELRYRNRHVDLIVTPGVKETFIKRISIIRHIRKILDDKNFYDVETPILQPVYGGAAAFPFTSHHRSLDIRLYLRISLEPYLKRLIVGGFDRVYEIGKCFRNEGIDRTHNPEFTMLELYQAYADFTDMMTLTEEIIEKTAAAITGSARITYNEMEIDLTPPWRRLKVTDALIEYAGLDVMRTSDRDLEAELKKRGVHIKGDFIRGLAIDELFKLMVEDKLIQPIFITHHPAETTPLCKPDYDDERFLQRFELFINGTEIANAYSESNDPVLQRKTLYEQSLRRPVDEDAPPMDENFVQAIEAGMPPAGGLGIGIDRLVMLLTGETSIRDVLLFPTMRPQD
ncbi:MAG: lysine--tRNA ligase [Spirochaetes bacterium RBG_13_51_14]|nr:MAG: lysine--tRNA ligase [Spirochaetes bacterium RBG_13_51_14]